ncbi:MAG: hypothetical protein IPI22_14135 [Bacteroidetes bacterium]|nr:hypothetical protein [Bacteroidota bacterium]
MFYNNPGAPIVSAVNGTFFGPNSSTDSVEGGGAGGATNSQRGFRFSSNETILNRLWKKESLFGTQRYVTIFNLPRSYCLHKHELRAGSAIFFIQVLQIPVC